MLSWLKRFFLILLCACVSEASGLRERDVRRMEGVLPSIGSGSTGEKAGSRGPRQGGNPKKPREPRSRPVNKGRCLDSAAAGGVVWTAFCRDIKDASVRKRCFEVGLESEQRRSGFCNNLF
jgi:hypothetical protein